MLKMIMLVNFFVFSGSFVNACLDFISSNNSILFHVPNRNKSDAMLENYSMFISINA